MGTTPPQPRLSEPLEDDDLIVYRAFSKKGFRERDKKVRPLAYHRPFDHTDGLSLGRTALAAVSRLQENYGYASIKVGDIRRLKYKLEVRSELDSPDHLLLCKLPPVDGTDEQRGAAAEIAGVLARLSKLETSDSFPKKQTEAPQGLP
jgi:hypothetical protein